MNSNIPNTTKKRIVVIGGGFAGLKIAKSLDSRLFQIVLVDRFNYHQFQPLLYQVATSGLEPSAIAFPFRKNLQKLKDVHFRLGEVTQICPSENHIQTSIGVIEYDYLVVATGTNTSYFGMKNIEAAAMPMKSISDALALRNRMLTNLELIVTSTDSAQTQALKNIVIVGGGPTGVEVAGAITEMKRYVFKRDYPDVDLSDTDIYLVEGSSSLLRTMSPEASVAAEKYLRKMGVKVMLDTSVVDYVDSAVVLKNGDLIPTHTLIWVSGVTGERIEGLDSSCYGPANRLRVDHFNQLDCHPNVFAIGDIAFMTTPKYPNGHPQQAQVAIQQGRLFCDNVARIVKGLELKPFHYNDRGSMATVGRNRAVADLRGFRTQGMFAWLIWMVVHLMSILGIKNRILIAINWVWSYITYDQSLRLIIRNGDNKSDTKVDK